MGRTLFGECGSTLVGVSTISHFGEELIVQWPSGFHTSLNYFTEYTLRGAYGERRIRRDSVGNGVGSWQHRFAGEHVIHET